MMYLLQLVKKPSRELEVNEAEFYKYRRKKPLWLPDFPGGPMVKNPPANAGDTSLMPGPERFSCLRASKLSSHN